MKKKYILLLVLLSFFRSIYSQINYPYKFTFNDNPIASIDTFKNLVSGKIAMYNPKNGQTTSVMIQISANDSIAILIDHDKNVLVKLDKNPIENSVKLGPGNFKYYSIKLDKQAYDASVVRIEFAYSRSFEVYDLLIFPLFRHLSNKKISLSFFEQT
ncbi:MAG TPA: hypothetical protein VIH57_06735 [Bacteroidales bacterium]